MDLAEPGQFEQAYRRHAPRAVAAAQAVLGDHARAEEVAQEVFCRLWRDPQRFDPQRGELGAYVVLMARSRALDLWRTDQTGRRARERMEAAAARAETPMNRMVMLLAEGLPTSSQYSYCCCLQQEYFLNGG